MIKIYRLEEPLPYCDVCLGSNNVGYSMTLRNLNITVCKACFQTIDDMVADADRRAADDHQSG